MTSPAYSIVYSALVSGVSGGGSPGDVLITNTAGTAFISATTANRGTRRSTGIALTSYQDNGTVEIQQSGQVSASLVPALGAGTASWVRVSTLGTLERCTPAGSDDVCGWVETDGTFHAQFGYLTAAIVNGGGGGGTVPTGTGFTHITAGAQDAAATGLTFTGDATGTGTAASIALTTVKINGATVPAGGALTTGNLLGVTGAGALSYGPLNLAGGANFVTGTLPVASVGAPTGTGFPHVTAGAYDGAAVALTWTGDATGTGTGASNALTVVKVNGATVPAAGALTTGNVPQVSGASALTYGPVNLAGGANFVSGALPTANQVSQAMAGDVTGTTAASVVAKVNGATVPAAGALVTGNAPYVSGVSALTYSALDLAGGAGWVTGLLPLANQAAPTGTGVAKVSAGAWTAAASLVSLTADVTGVLPLANGGTNASTGLTTANGVVTSSGTALQQASGVLAGTNFISIGATPVAAAGNIRLPSAPTTVMAMRDAGNTTDWRAISATATNLTFGDNANTWSTVELQAGLGGIAKVTGHDIQIYAQTTAGIDLEVNSQYVLLLKQDTIQVAQPVIGMTLNSSPYGVHGRMAKRALAAATTYTVTAAEYCYQVLQFSSTTASACTITLPDAPNEAGCYFKDIDVTQCNVSQSVTFTAGAGTRTASITGGGASVPGVPKRIFVSPGCVDLAPG